MTLHRTYTILDSVTSEFGDICGQAQSEESHQGSEISVLSGSCLGIPVQDGVVLWTGTSLKLVARKDGTMDMTKPTSTLKEDKSGVEYINLLYSMISWYLRPDETQILKALRLR